MHIHICTDYSVFPVELLYNGGDYGEYSIGTPTSLILAASPPSYPLAAEEFSTLLQVVYEGIRKRIVRSIRVSSIVA